MQILILPQKGSNLSLLYMFFDSTCISIQNCKTAFCKIVSKNEKIIIRLVCYCGRRPLKLKARGCSVTMGFFLR